MAITTDTLITAAQREIVEWGDGPLVVIAGAGTGKTRVIVERVRWLLETKGEAGTSPGGDLVLREPVEGGAADDDPFTGPLQPEQILVLTYNVKAARELADRIETAIGPAARARLPVSNFHSFCHRILTESAADAGLPAQPDVLDGIAQVLLLRDIRPNLPLLYYAGGSNPNRVARREVRHRIHQDEVVEVVGDLALVDRQVLQPRVPPSGGWRRAGAQANLGRKPR